MTIWALIPLITSISYIILLIFTLQTAQKRVNKTFAYFLGIASLWSFTSFMLHFNAFPEQARLWNELLIIALIWTLLAYYHFIHNYVNVKVGKSLYSGYGLLVILAGLSLGGLIVRSASVTDGILTHDVGYSVYIISAVGVAFSVAIVTKLIKKYRSSVDPIARNRTMYLVTGWCILVAMTLTNNIPSLASFPLDHMGNLANAIIISYAISRYQLLNIRLVVRRGLTFVILIISMVAIYMGFIFVGLSLFPDETIAIVSAATAIVILIALISAPLRSYIQRQVDRMFYRDTYESRLSLLSFSNKMGNILNLEELSKEMLPSMTTALNIRHASLLFQTTKDSDFVVKYAHPTSKSTEEEDVFRLSSDSPIISWLDKTGNPLNPEQIDSIPEFKGLWQTEKEQVTGAGIGFLHPIKSRGKLIGILELGHKLGGGPYSHEDLDLVSGIANQAGIIIENAQLYTQATYRATTDELTKLYNHRNFHERLEQEIARGSRFGTTFSLIMLDLDLFKAYNDIYGHLAGDQLLRKIGQAMENSIRAIDLAFRYGGEEFAVILPETRLDDAYRVAERIRKTIESRTSFREMPVTASLGIASWPNDGVMKEEIISRADSALYRAKQTGRNRTCLSSDVLKPQTPEIGAELEAQPRALSIIYALAATVDAKDHYTYGHSRKVSEYAVALAEMLKLPTDRVDTIRAGGLLHDIGKLGVPDSILTKAGPLDDDEWEPIKSHPELGVEILKRVIDLVNCLPAILHHHEHYDGSGYPKGLKGESIPLEARILSVADAYDAITSPRPYRAQLTSEQAIAELKRCAGSQFDPKLVEKFCKVLQPGPAKNGQEKIKPAGENQQ